MDRRDSEVGAGQGAGELAAAPEQPTADEIDELLAELDAEQAAQSGLRDPEESTADPADTVDEVQDTQVDGAPDEPEAQDALGIADDGASLDPMALSEMPEPQDDALSDEQGVTGGTDSVDSADAGDGLERRSGAAAQPSGPRPTRSVDRAQVERNIAALQLAKTLRDTDTAPTDDERQALSAYSSWGGLAAVFDENETSYREYREQLKDVLDAKEYNAARRTILTAYYTPPEIVDATWSALRTAGLRQGTVLEPGCGVGDFLSATPDGVRTVGVELDPMSALIASALHPDAQIRRESFVDTDFTDHSFTATIGNVPFSQAKPNDPVRNRIGMPLHDYFISKSADLTAPGGYVAVITSAHTADKQRQNGVYGSREAITEHADFITGVRLPGGKNGAFATTAGTQVITDLLIFRVRETGQEPTETTRRFLDTDVVDLDGGQVTVNGFFADNPDHVLGDFHAGNGRFGIEQKVTRDTADNAALGEQISRIVDADVTAAVDAGYGLTAATDGVDTTAVDFSGLVERGTAEMNQVVGTLRYEVADNGTYSFEQYLPGNDGSAASWQEVKPRPKSLGPEWAALVDLRDTLRGLQLASEDDELEAADALRETLSQQYDDYVETYGYINRHTYAPPRTPTATQAEKKLDELVADWRRDNAIGDRPFEGELPEGVIDELREIASSPVENRTPVRKHLRGAISDDPFMNTVYALEQYSEETGTAKKGAWFSINPLRTVTEVTHADNLADAVTIAESSHGGLTSQRIAALRDQPVEQVEQELEDTGLAFRDHDDPDWWVAPVSYLSGNVRLKLREAEALVESGDDRYQGNVDALRDAQPEKRTDGITMNIGAAWIPEDIYKDFIVEKTGMPRSAARALTVRHIGDEWVMTREPKQWSGQDDAAMKFGLVAKHYPNERYNFEMSGEPGRLPHCGVATRYQSRNMVISAEQMIVNAMNLAAPKVRWSSTLGKEYPEYRGTHMAATQFAGRKVSDIETEFNEWITADPERHARLVDVYNEKFNAIVAPKYDGSAREMPGLGSKFTPYPYQLDAVERMTHEPAVLLNHVVGAGKTGTMIMGAMELKRLGKVNKPWLVVPNHLVEQIARESKQWYPAANVLSGASARGSAKNRQLFLSQSAGMDWDLVVVPESVFTATGLRSEGMKDYSDRKLVELHRELEQMNAEGAIKSSVKDIEYKIDSYEARIKKEIDKAKKDDGLRFEDTGCDYIIADEAHGYKNLLRPSRVDDLTGAASGKASDMDMKLDHLRHTHGPGHPVATFATGTPIANNIAELWVMQQYLRPDLLAEAGISGVNAWGSNFTQSVTDVDFSAGGRIVEKSRVSSYVNVGDLSMACTPFMDVVTTDQITADLPEVRGGGPTVVEFEPGIEVQDFIADLPWREEHFSRELVKIDNPLKVVGDGKNVTLDPRLAGLDGPPAGVGRINAVCDNIITEWQNNRDNIYTDQIGETSPNPGGLQIVFCDKGVPNKQGKFSVYEAIREELVSRGMDRDRIRFIHEWDTKKLQLFDDCNNGAVDVVIGNTQKMGTGANLQARAVALHNVDVPWRPADLEQQRGRIIRQGNQNAEVGLYEYVGQGTYDGYSWGVLYRKAKFIEQFHRADPSMREAESLESEGSDAMAHNRALATGNEDFVVQMRLRREIATLKSRKSEHEALVASNARELADMQRMKPVYDKMIRQHEQVADSVDKWIAATSDSNAEGGAGTTADDAAGEKSWEFGGQTYTERKDAARAASDIMRQVVSSRNVDPQTIGNIAGVPITARYSHEMSGVMVQTIPASSEFGKTIGEDKIIAGRDNEPTEQLAGEIRQTQSQALTMIENSIRGMPRQRERVQSTALSIDKALDRLQSAKDGGFPQESELEGLIQEEKDVSARLVEFEKSDAEKQRRMEQKRRMHNAGRLPGWTLALNPTSHMVEEEIEEHPDTQRLRARMESKARTQAAQQRTGGVQPIQGLFPSTMQDSLRQVKDNTENPQQKQSRDQKPDGPTGPTGPTGGSNPDSGPSM